MFSGERTCLDAVLRIHLTCRHLVGAEDLGILVLELFLLPTGAWVCFPSTIPAESTLLPRGPAPRVLRRRSPSVFRDCTPCVVWKFLLADFLRFVSDEAAGGRLPGTLSRTSLRLR